MVTREELLRAKIPCEQTGITVKRTFCDICAPGHHCGIDAYIKDGNVIKIEGTREHPYNHGLLCTKGCANRQYVYRKDRLLTPMKRVGPRGGSRFEPITWDEAYQTIAENFNRFKAESGADSVAFYSGYGKWFRPMMKRFLYSFGSINYATESSCCFDASAMAWESTAGVFMGPDMARANTMLGWAMNPHYSGHLAVAKIQAFKERGGKLIIVDPRVTPTSEKYADIHLQLKPGTDGALALGMAKVIIDNGWQDKEFIEKYTYGYEEYAAYVQQFPLDRVARITGVPADKIYEAAKLYATNGPAATQQSSSPVTHHRNGFQNYRAKIALSGLTGNVDRAGGVLPSVFSYNYRPGGFATREQAFTDAVKPREHKPRIGLGQFPVWDALMPDEFQVMSMRDQLLSGTPYRIRGLFAVGMNLRMFPDTEQMAQALEKLDFMVASDLFFTDTVKYADIILPACSSFERSEMKVYPGGNLVYYKPAIAPLGQSKPDTQIFSELSRVMGLGDELLEAGYDRCMEYIISDLHITLDDLKKSELPIHCPDARPVQIGALREHGFHTPTGRFEFVSQLVARAGAGAGLDALPTFRDSTDDMDAQQYPLVAVTGARIPHAIHSRLHEVPWLRSMQKEPVVTMNPADAACYGIREGDSVRVTSPTGSIVLKAAFSIRVLEGNLYIYHGYREANVNQLVPGTHLDPYSGFPGYKSVRCSIKKEEE